MLFYFDLKYLNLGLLSTIFFPEVCNLVKRLSVKIQQNRSYYSTILKLGSFIKDDMLLHMR